MGSGFKVFSAGAVLTASEVNNYLMEQSIMTFATTAARDAAITAPEDGMVCYVTGDTSLYQYETISAVSAWRKLAAQVPHAVATTTAATAGTTASTSAVVIPGTSVTATITKHRADTTLFCSASFSNFYVNALAQISYFISTSATDTKVATATPGANVRAQVSGECSFTGLAAGSQVITLKVSVSGGTFNADTSCISSLMVTESL